jgi:hypothetical protein
MPNINVLHEAGISALAEIRELARIAIRVITNENKILLYEEQDPWRICNQTKNNQTNIH